MPTLSMFYGIIIYMYSRCSYFHTGRRSAERGAAKQQAEADHSMG